MDSVTLLESGTGRAHFALVKKIELAETAEDADRVVLEAVTNIKRDLTGKQRSLLAVNTSISQQLLVLLHAVSVFPHSLTYAHQRLDLDFALTPTLTLLATAQSTRDLQIAYALLHTLPGLKAKQETVDNVSLLLLNTVREHLGTRDNADAKGKARRNSEPTAATRKLKRARRIFALRSIINGLPAGADCVPALFAPITDLLFDEDVTIKALAMHASNVIGSYRHDVDRGEAQAAFNRLRQAFTRPGKESHLESRRASKSKPTREAATGDVLTHAYLSSIREACSKGSISATDAIRTTIDSARPVASQWVAVSALRYVRTLAQNEGVITEEMQEPFTLWCRSMLEHHMQSLPVLLELARLRGTITSREIHLDKLTPTLWQATTSHLTAKNPNRLYFSIQTLHALLPLEWPVATTQDSEHVVGHDSLCLNEEEMQRLLSLLGHADSSIRRATLRLLYDIDIAIPTQHLESLKEAMNNSSRSAESADLCRRAVEVLCVCLSTSSSENRSNAFATSLGGVLKSLDIEIENKLAMDISMALQQVSRKEAVEAIYTLTGLLDEQGCLPAHALLLASLVCALVLDASVPDETLDDCLVRLSSCLARSSTEAAVQEAWVVAIARLVPFASDRGIEASGTLLAEHAVSASGRIVRIRIAQIERLTRSDRKKLRLQFPSASLLDTLGALERCAATSPSLQEQDRDRQRRPLRYAPYVAETSRVLPKGSKSDDDEQPSEDVANREQTGDDLLA